MALGFTVSIPTHNRRETVVLAVRSCLEQTRPPLEVIVLADGCTDGTAEALRDLGDERVRVLELDKAPGYAYAHRNLALEQARGEVIAYLGDDDMYLPDHFERIGELWDAGIADVVLAGACLVHERDELQPMTDEWTVPRMRARMLDGENRVPMGAVSLTVEIARRAGGWDGSRPREGDLDLWQRVLRAGARSATSLVPTLLHFRATTRDQPWDDRVHQNGAWFERMRDPAERAWLRRAYAQALGEREQARLDEIAELERQLLVARHEAELLREQRAVFEAQRDTRTAELEKARQDFARVDAEREALLRATQPPGSARGSRRLRR